jgi:hypothetical protein
MIQLHDKDSGAPIGTITEDNLRFLIDQLEEESGADQDYYFTEATIGLLEKSGAADTALVSLLRRAFNGRAEMEVRWSRS